MRKDNKESEGKEEGRVWGEVKKGEMEGNVDQCKFVIQTIGTQPCGSMIHWGCGL